jgi:hypothetical protein
MSRTSESHPTTQGIPWTGLFNQSINKSMQKAFNLVINQSIKFNQSIFWEWHPVRKENLQWNSILKLFYVGRFCIFTF